MRALAAKPEVGNDFRFFLLYWEIAQGQRGESRAFKKNRSGEGGAHAMQRGRRNGGSGAKARHSRKAVRVKDARTARMLCSVEEQTGGSGVKAGNR